MKTKAYNNTVNKGFRTT